MNFLKMIYFIRDVPGGDYFGPFMCKDDFHAIRQFEGFLKTVPESLDTSDFQLLCVAEFDETNVSGDLIRAVNPAREVKNGNSRIASL